MIVKDLSNSFNPVPKKEKIIKEKSTEIKKRSKKQDKIERQRDKNRVKEGKCDYCKKEKKRLDPHEVYGGSNRKRSILNNFVKMLCRECHSSEAIINQLRIDAQKEFEKTHTREEFIKIIGKSYIKG
jgi:hypothetical protein